MVNFLALYHWTYANSSQGDNIVDFKPVRRQWKHHALLSQCDKGLSLNLIIYSCSDQDPTNRPTGSLRPSAKLEPDSPIDVTSLPKFRGADGNIYKEIVFDIEMSIIGAALEFALWHKGKRIGCRSLEAEVEDG
jgi:hypothetical protein